MNKFVDYLTLLSMLLCCIYGRTILTKYKTHDYDFAMNNTYLKSAEKFVQQMIDMYCS